LDGLDEVPLGIQRRIMELARQASSARPDYQFIVTAREHVTGPWLSWLARIHISPLNDSKIRQLIDQLLSREQSKVQDFYTQLATVPGLKPLLRIPLLCTLTTSVFEGSGSLPETKAELYRIFVDLLCGGWDIAKGIKRRSDFGATVKLRFLINLAAHLHSRKKRSLRSDEMRQRVLKSGFVHLSAWESLVGDIVQDGLLTRDGNSYAFSHLSFQEYLCAKDAADPQSERDRIDKIIGTFLDGDEWWREVILFYSAMSNKPDQMRLRVRSAMREKDTAKAEQRGEDLCDSVMEMFPAIGPIARTDTGN
jgi:predicted NACHT family NTPase